MKRHQRLVCLWAALLLAACGGNATKPTSVSTSASTQRSTQSSTSSQASSLPPASLSVLPSGSQHISLDAGAHKLNLFVLGDDLVYLRYSTTDTVPELDQLFSEMIAEKNFTGASKLAQDGNHFSTSSISIAIDNNLCVTVADLIQHQLNQTCPGTLTDTQFSLTIKAPDTTQAYGLGEQFFDAGSNGDWLGRQRLPGIAEGNRMVNFVGGQVGNLQIPVLLSYQKEPASAVGYLLDAPQAQQWDLRNKDSWTIAGNTGDFGLFIFTKPDLVALRSQYMQLTGRPPVPPKSAFGLWVSEYGFDNWAEAENKILAQQSANMPLDGLVLDLQWFGGIAKHRMGSLSWDTQAFPNPAARLQSWKQQWGVEAVTIEESYIDSQTADYANLGNLGYLVRRCAGCNNSFFNQWWGTGGMLDWTNREGAAFWHNTKRSPLIAAGVAGHWTDLGEPENFDSTGWYEDTYNNRRHSQADVHNLYNFYWSKSIFDGYQREQPDRRPWTLSRSGTAGSQRFGTALWSGDIGTNSQSLAAHLQVQMQMSMSGIDYFGSDVGGFHRGTINTSDFNRLFTLWFANSALLDIPLRPHTSNLCNCYETAPALTGDVASNKYNLQLRYALVPYYYSLAHTAWRTGVAMFPPLTYYHPDDANTKGLGTVKYLGPWLIARSFAQPTEAAKLPSYVPAGNWLDWHRQTWISSSGQNIDLSAIYEGKTTLPLLAKEGAIIPMMVVDDQTMNLKGQRRDGSQREELLIRVLASPVPSQFTLYEDDGVSSAYQTGAVAETLISQATQNGEILVTIAPTQGSYSGMPASRAIELELFQLNGDIAKAFFNEELLPEVTREQFEGLDQAALKLDGGHWRVKLAAQSMTEIKTLRFTR